MNVLSIAIHGGLILIGCWFYLKFYCTAEYRLLFVLAFLFKMACGVLMGFLYINYFEGGDSLVYFKEAVRMANYASEFGVNLRDVLVNTDPNHPFMLESVYSNQPRALLFSKVVYILYLFTGGNFWIISVYLSIFSFVGFWVFYVVIAREKIISTTTLTLALFTWPSVVFWSSGLIKESVSVGLILLISSIVVSVNFRGYKVWLVLLFIGLSFILFKIKYYYAGILVPLAVSYCIIKLIMNKWPGFYTFPARQILIFLGLFIFLVALATNLHPNLNLNYISIIIVDNYYLFIEKSMAGKALEFNKLEPSFFSLALHTPRALFAGLFRPNLLDIMNSWSLLAALENAILLLLAIFQLKNFRKIGEGDTILKLSIILFCIIMAIFLSFSAPNFGTLVRYKAGFMPFLIMLIISGNPIVKWVKKARVKSLAN